MSELGASAHTITALTDLTVLQVNASDIGGGAEKVMLDLHREYLARGVDSWIAVGDVVAPDSRTLLIDNRAARSAWTRMLSPTTITVRGRESSRSLGPMTLARLVASDPSRYRRILTGLEDFDFPATETILDLPPRRPDLLHLHNLHGYYFDLRMLPQISSAVPTVLTLHDVWLLTGHCAHPFDCPRWRTGCGQCPDLSMYVPIRRDASAENWLAKRDILERSRLCLVTPSEWLMGMVRESGLAATHPSHVIPNGVDTTVFHPGDMAHARRELGLPQDRPILLVVANTLTANPFKDPETLIAALQQLAHEAGPRPLLVALGARAEMVMPELEVRSVPYTEDAEKVAAYYQAADLYVHAAHAENLPLTIIEAMACGTAVIATDVGGIPEAVVSGETGVLVPRGDVQALADAIRGVLGDDARRRTFGAAGTGRVLQRFTLTRQVEAYLALYRELRDLWSPDV